MVQRNNKPKPGVKVADVQADDNQTIIADETPPVQAPEFIDQDPPKLGIILGPGGALSFAMIGFLQELESQKVPVQAIGGVEWGSLIGATYASTNKAHATEWQLLKLPIDRFYSKGFFSGGSAPGIASFDAYLNDLFKNQTSEDLEIGFACPYINLNRASAGVFRKGRVRSAAKLCWPSSPHFAIESVGANLGGIKSLANQLRNMGAELIVYIDVLSDSKILSRPVLKSKKTSSLHWIQAQDMVDMVGPPFVDEVISLPVQGHHMDSYKKVQRTH